MAVFRSLNEAQHVIVLDAVKEELPRLINSAEQLRFVFEYLNETQRTVVFDAVQRGLPTLITDAWQLVGILQPLSDAQRTEVFYAVQERLSDLITNPEQLAGILQYLRSAQRTVVFNAVHKGPSMLIRNAEQLMGILRYLKEAQRTAVFYTVQKRLPELITDAEQLVRVLLCFNEAQCAAILGAVQEKLPVLMAEPGLLVRVLSAVSISQCMMLLNGLTSNTKGLSLLLSTSAKKSEPRCSYLHQMLEEMVLAGHKLKKHGLLADANTLQELYIKVNDSFSIYQNSPKLNGDYILFKNNSKQAIIKAWGTLEINYICAKLLIGVVALGIRSATNTLSTVGRPGFFEINTDSENKESQPEVALDNIKKVP